MGRCTVCGHSNANKREIRNTDSFIVSTGLHPHLEQENVHVVFMQKKQKRQYCFSLLYIIMYIIKYSKCMTLR